VSSEPARERALVIVPTYNERENIQRLIDAVLRQDGRIEMLVVDDGSPDGTGQLVADLEARDPRVHLLSRPSKLGLGTAYIAGFRWALEREYDYVL
jgi:dolichol-phosphate mannosyltransferase